MLRSKSGVGKKQQTNCEIRTRFRDQSEVETQTGLFYPGRNFIKAYDHPVEYYTKIDQVIDRRFLQPAGHEATEIWI